MQLGTRWPIGGEIPPRIPESMVVAIQGVETELMDSDTSNWRWTLTWLEGKPTVELDDGTVIRLDAAGDANVQLPEQGGDRPGLHRRMALGRRSA